MSTRVSTRLGKQSDETLTIIVSRVVSSGRTASIFETSSKATRKIFQTNVSVVSGAQFVSVRSASVAYVNVIRYALLTTMAKNDDDNSDSFERNSPSTPDLDIRSDPESAIRAARSILIDPRVRVTRTKGVKNDPTLLRSPLHVSNGYFIAVLSVLSSRFLSLWKAMIIQSSTERFAR